MAKSKKMDLLARDVAAARAAGMSYGKWRAMRFLKGDIEEVQAPVQEERRTCPVCGMYFRPNRNQRYCDFNCQRMAQMQRNHYRAAVKSQ